MKLSDFFSGQRVIRQVLDWLQLSKTDAIKERVTDTFSDGIVQGLFNNLNVVGKDLAPTLTDFFHVAVDIGVAYKNGERVLVDSLTTPYNYTNLVHTTDDGSGAMLPTPRSTGSFDIPLTAGVFNYLWIAYFETTDDSVFTLHKVTNLKQFYKRTDGYEILANTTALNPDPSRYLLLAAINLTGSNTAVAANIDITGRSHYRTTKLRVGIETNNIGVTDRPATYSTGNLNLSLDDHIKSIGTGPVSPINPHGLSADDLGLTESQLVRSHRKIEHQNGIAGTIVTLPITSALYVEVVDREPAADSVRIKPLLNSELAVIDGIAFGNADYPVEVELFFNSDPTGTYQIYFDSVSRTVGKTSSSITADNTKLWLASVNWDLPSLDLSGFVDRRRFNTTQKMARWSTGGRPVAPDLGAFGYNMTLSTAEYWNGTIWKPF